MAMLRLSCWAGFSALLLSGCATLYAPPPSPAQSTPPVPTPFQAEYVPELKEPEVVIENSADQLIDLTLVGGESRAISIPAHSTQSLKVSAGEYVYKATAQGVKPASGTQIFDRQHRYTWKFFIQTVPAASPPKH